MAIQVFVPFVLFVVEKVSRPEFSWVGTGIETRGAFIRCNRQIAAKLTGAWESLVNPA
jgi:hypothetical protein